MEEKKENSPIRYAAKMLYTYIWQNINKKRGTQTLKDVALVAQRYTHYTTSSYWNENLKKKKKENIYVIQLVSQKIMLFY